MTNFQRWALAIVIQAYQKEIRPPHGIIRGQRKKVKLARTGVTKAVFNIEEISFNGVSIEDEVHRAKFYSLPFNEEKDYKFRTQDDYTGDGDYYLVRITSKLTDSYIEGQNERGYRFNAQMESYTKVRIFDQQTGQDHFYEISN